jgi:bacterioferritin-associated ferredoxin
MPSRRTINPDLSISSFIPTATDLAAFPVIQHWCRSKADWHINPTLASPPSCLRGADDGVDPPKPSDIDAQHFTSAYEQRTIAGVGAQLAAGSACGLCHCRACSHLTSAVGNATSRVEQRIRLDFCKPKLCTCRSISLVYFSFARNSKQRRRDMDSIQVFMRLSGGTAVVASMRRASTPSRICYRGF